MRVLGLSLITNVPEDFLGDEPDPEALHKQVLAVGAESVPIMTRLLIGALGRMASQS
jgi:hypothetical protein